MKQFSAVVVVAVLSSFFPMFSFAHDEGGKKEVACSNHWWRYGDISIVASPSLRFIKSHYDIPTPQAGDEDDLIIPIIATLETLGPRATSMYITVKNGALSVGAGGIARIKATPEELELKPKVEKCELIF